MSQSNKPTMTIELVTDGDQRGVLVKIDPEADYVAVINSDRMTPEHAERLARELAKTLGRNIPIVVCNGDVKFLRVPKDLANESNAPVPPPARETEAATTAKPDTSRTIRLISGALYDVPPDDEDDDTPPYHC